MMSASNQLECIQINVSQNVSETILLGLWDDLPQLYKYIVKKKELFNYNNALIHNSESVEMMF